LNIIIWSLFNYCIDKEDWGWKIYRSPIKSKSKKQKLNSVKALLKADRGKEIEQYGKQVSMRPSKVHRSKKDYDRRKNKVDERELD
jgi:hypothetical protein